MKSQPSSIEIQTNSADETVLVGAAVGRCCIAGDIVALQGELGAGKTQFVRGLARGMGIDPRQVSSPTFVLMQEYEPIGKAKDQTLLVHIDAYRITSPEDLASIGWVGHGRELREQAVVAVEWASLIKPALGDDVLWVEVSHAPHGRRILLSAKGTWLAKMKVLSDCLLENSLNLTEGAEP